MRSLYAVKHIPTGFYIQDPKGVAGRGGSFSTPQDCSLDNPNPRLFKSHLAAKRFLSQWLRGEQHGLFEYDEDFKYTVGAEVVPQPDRIKEDMKIVEFVLTLWE